MPSGYLHQLCAERACGMAGITPVEGDALCLGAQGPDPLFVLGMFPLRLSSRPSKVGALIHQHRTGAFLCALADRAKRGTAVERAFTMGFFTHYALDSTVHPYVYSQSLDRHGRYSSALHMRLEKRWDALYYRRAGHRGTPGGDAGPGGKPAPLGNHRRFVDGRNGMGVSGLPLRARHGAARLCGRRARQPSDAQPAGREIRAGLGAGAHHRQALSGYLADGAALSPARGYRKHRAPCLAQPV